MLDRIAPLNDERADFGAQLCLQRERRAIALSSVAETTKIAESLLAALERGDISKWPAGIYRRAFFREYAAAIGLPCEAATAEFLRVFDDGKAGERGELRLTLAPEKRPRASSVITRIASAMLDAGLVLVAGWALSRALRVDLWIVTAVVALVFQALAALVLGRGPAFSIIRAWLSQRDRSAEPFRPSSRAALRVVQLSSRRKSAVASQDPARDYVKNARSAS